MSCTPGCCGSPAEHYRSVNFADRRRQQPKVTTDDHGTHTVDVIQHYDLDRQDVVVKGLPPVATALASPSQSGA